MDVAFGRISRWKTTASLDCPNVATARASPNTREPAGITRCCWSDAYTGTLTRQFTGPGNVPSRRLVSTVSMKVPSNRRYFGLASDTPAEAGAAGDGLAGCGADAEFADCRGAGAGGCVDGAGATAWRGHGKTSDGPASGGASRAWAVAGVPAGLPVAELPEREKATLSAKRARSSRAARSSGAATPLVSRSALTRDSSADGRRDGG